jgi:hypothetical protein
MLSRVVEQPAASNLSTTKSGDPRAVCYARSRPAHLTYHAGLHHGLDALELAEQVVDRRAWTAARAQVREALRCSVALPILRGTMRVARRLAWTLIRPHRAVTT